MDSEIKRLSNGWESKNAKQGIYGIITGGLVEIDKALLKCDEILSTVSLGIDYTSQKSAIDEAMEDRITLHEYIDKLPEQIRDSIDTPLQINFKENATEAISRIRMEDFKTENTLGLKQPVAGTNANGSYREFNDLKEKLGFFDFMGISEGEYVEEFAKLFKEQFENFKQGLQNNGKDVDLTLKDFYSLGEFYHDSSNAWTNFLSSVLDFTIIKPVIEACTGEDLITGEDLSNMERGCKVLFAIIDAVSLGTSIAVTSSLKLGAKETLKMILKNVGIEGMSNLASNGVMAVCEVLEIPAPVAILLSVVAGVSVSYVGNTAVFKNAAGEKICEVPVTDTQKKTLQDKGQCVVEKPDTVVALDKEKTTCSTVGEPINAITGSLTEKNVDLSIKDAGENFTVERSYESLNNIKGILGYGWSSSLEIKIIETKSRVSLLCEDGHYENFCLKNDKYENEKGNNKSYQLKKTDKGWEADNFHLHKKYLFDKNGKIKTVTNKEGKTLKFEYNENSEISKIITFSGQIIKTEFSNGKLKSVEDVLGRKIIYNYKGDYLTEVIYPEGGKAGYIYNENNLLISITDQNGNTHTENIYDQIGRVKKQRFWDGSFIYCFYNDLDRENTIAYSANSREEIYRYDENNLTTEIVYWDGTKTEYKYDEFQNCIYEKNRNGNVTRRKYNEYGNITEEINPDGLKTFYEYDKNGHITRISDSTGIEILNQYDKNYNIISQKINSDGKNYRKEKFEYDELNRIISKTDALGNKTVYKYNSQSSQILYSPSEVITPSGYSYKYEYDAAERNTKIITEHGTTEYEYNSLNYPVRIKDRDGNVIIKKYDKMGKLIEEQTPNLLAENSGKSFKFWYNEWDELIAAENPLGAVRKVMRDGENNIIKRISPKVYEKIKKEKGIYPEKEYLRKAQGIRHIYDRGSRCIKNIFEDGGTERFFYDAEGNLLKHIEPENYDSKTDNGDGYSYSYDGMNRLCEIINEKGEKEHIFKYDLHGNLIEDTDVYGNTSYFSYDALGNLIEKRIPIDEAGLEGIKSSDKENKLNIKDNILYSVIIYEYDAVGNKILEKHGIDKVYKDEECKKFNEISFEYDAEGRLIKVKDKSGAKTEYRYDSLNNKIFESFKINDETTKKVHYKYNGRGLVTERTEELTEGIVIPCRGKDQLLSKTFYEYDADGNLIKIKESDGMEVLRKYDEIGRCTEQIEKDSCSSILRKASYTYDLNDNVTEIVRTAGKNGKEKVQKYTYDEKDRIIKVQGINGGITRIFYDKNDRVIREINPEEYRISGDNAKGTAYSYNIRSQITEITDPLGNIQKRNGYDKLGNLISETDALGNKTELKYTVAGRIKEIITPNSRKFNKPAQTFRYDARGNITGITDGNGNKTEYVLDDWGRISEIHAADGGIEKYTYDYAGNITSTTDANGGKIEYRYNQFNQPVEIKDQMGMSEYFDYDSHGRLTAHKNRNNIISEREYNAEGSLLKLYAYKEGSPRTLRRRYAYDEEGMVITAEAPEITYNYEYTADGRLKKKSSSGKRLAEYTYDLNGQIKSLKDSSSRSTLYYYDALGRIEKITDEKDNHLASYKYLKNSLLEAVTLGNGVKTGYNYDEEGNIIKLLTKTSDGEVLSDYSYSYDLNGNRLSKTGNRYNNRYQYDSMNRLKSADYGNKKEIFTYDKAGNRITRTEGGITEKYSYNAKNQLVRIDFPGADTPINMGRMPLRSCMDFFEELGAKKKNNLPKIFEYDPQGNMTSEITPEGQNIFEYDELNHQVMAKMHNGDTLRSVYDAEDLRFKIHENGKISTFVFNQNSEIISESDNEEIVSRFARGYDIVAADIRADEGEQNVNSTINLNSSSVRQCFYSCDEQGSTEFITDSLGNVNNSYKYDAFGNELEAEEKIHNRIKYTGQQWDNATQQYYLRARFYNPQISRFTQEDTYRGDGLNLYAYCSNNSVNYYDPSGYICEEKYNAYKSARKRGLSPSKSLEYARYKSARKKGFNSYQAFDYGKARKKGLNHTEAYELIIKEYNNILNKPIRRWNNKELQKAVDSIHYAQYQGESWGNSNPISLTVSKDGSHIILSKNNGIPGRKSRAKANEIFGEENVEFVKGGKKTNYKNDLKNGHHAEARGIQYMLSNDINTKNSKQAISHYSCDACANKQKKYSIQNITGVAAENKNIIKRNFLKQLW